MAKLFGKNKLRDRAQRISTDEIIPFIALVEAWRTDYHTGSLRTDNETAREQAYNQTFFKDILGYEEKPADPYSFQPKASTEYRGIPDAIIGHFENADNSMNFSAVVELKGAGVNLDRPQRGEGNLSPVQQGFKYKPLYRSVPFVIVSNFWEFRLYNDNQLDYEVWTLDDLVDPEDDFLAFKSWYVLLRRENFTAPTGQSATERLLSDIRVEQEEVGKTFYQQYKAARLALIAEIQQFNPARRDDLDFVIAKAQKIIDRIIFAAFAEDKGLLPDHTLYRLKKGVEDSRTGRRLWSALQDFFFAIDQGNPGLDIPEGYNGGLFAHDDELNRLMLGHDALAKVIDFSGYNFDEELSVTILGHIFEQSITDIEAMKSGDEPTTPDASKRSRRKQDGIFYTPDYIVRYIVENSLGVYLREHEDRFRTEARLHEGINEKNYARREHDAYVAYYEFLRNIKVVDPACGSGAFLVYVFDYLLAEHQRVGTILGYASGAGDFDQVYRNILRNNIYGVDLNEESVEIAKLSLWLKTAVKGKKLTALDKNLKVGNSLIDDPEVAGDKAFNWEEQFPEVFAQGGFDVVVGNPPYGVTFNSTEKKYLENFDQVVPDYEIYIYFITLGLRLLVERGIVSYIVPNTFLSNLYGAKYRTQLFTNQQVNWIVDLSHDQTFKDASVRNIMFALRRAEGEYTSELLVSAGKDSIKTRGTVDQSQFISNAVNTSRLFSLTKEGEALLGKILSRSKPMSTSFDISQGLIPYDKYVGHSEELIKSRGYHASFQKDSTYRKELMGGDVSPYHIEWNGENWISYGDWLAGPRDPKYFNAERILVREITGRTLNAAVTSEEYYNTPSIINCVPNTSEVKILSTLAVLNSSLIAWLHRSTSPKANKGLFPKILVNDVRNLPIPTEPPELLEGLSTSRGEVTERLFASRKKTTNLFLSALSLDTWPAKLTHWWTLSFPDVVRSLKKKPSVKQSEQVWEIYEKYRGELEALDTEIQRLDREIDQLVYQLYELTPEEIALVEASV